MTEDPDGLRSLLDRAAITDLITAYTRAIDEGRFAALHDLFTHDAVLDYSSVGGPVGAPAQVVPWIEEGLRGFLRTQHIIGQIEFRFAGESCQTTAYFTNPMVAPGPADSETLVECGGYYHHDFVRLGERWRMARLTDELIWMRGL